jgi:predicted DCC family thiol-disulfide oxidoreductase YuxK
MCCPTSIAPTTCGREARSTIASPPARARVPLSGLDALRVNAPGFGEPVLLYDGCCGFCNAAVRFVLKRDRGTAMRFAPLQGVFGAAVVARHPELRTVDSLVLVRCLPSGEELVATRSESVIGVARYLGGPWRAGLVVRLLPRPFRDWAYDMFARNRHRAFARYDSCPVPDAATRDRFLE